MTETRVPNTHVLVGTRRPVAQSAITQKYNRESQMKPAVSVVNSNSKTSHLRGALGSLRRLLPPNALLPSVIACAALAPAATWAATIPGLCSLAVRARTTAIWSPMRGAWRQAWGAISRPLVFCRER